MKKITMKKEFLGESICYTFFGVGAGLMFLGVILSVIEDSITLSIGVISICVGVGLMIMAGLAQNEGMRSITLYVTVYTVAGKRVNSNELLLQKRNCFRNG